MLQFFSVSSSLDASCTFKAFDLSTFSNCIYTTRQVHKLEPLHFLRIDLTVTFIVVEFNEELHHIWTKDLCQANLEMSGFFVIKILINVLQ